MNNTNQTKARMLSEMIEVKELSHPQDVNTHIKQGWKLLDTYTASNGQQQGIKYCVGWPKSAGSLNAISNTTLNTPISGSQPGRAEQLKASGRKSFIYSL